MIRKLSRRPKRSPGNPASMAPTTVPQIAIETVIPRLFDDRLKTCDSWPVVPEMTAVSNPNSRPPRAATTVLFNKTAFNFMPSPDARVLFQARQLQRLSSPESHRVGWRLTLLRDSRNQQLPGWATLCLNRAEKPPQTHRRRRPCPELERDSRGLRQILRS